MMKTQIPDFQEFPQYILSAYFNTIYTVNVIFRRVVTGQNRINIRRCII